MSHTRVIFYIDGFNLYHALVGLGKPHLKWVNLRKLCQHFVSDPRHYIEDIYYFSAYANRGYKVRERHEAYIQALESIGVKFILGKFKKKDRECKLCHHKWKANEEKQTDVNIALHILNDAHQNKFDKAVLVSADSDFVPVIKLTKKQFPKKQLHILTPVNREYSWDLRNAVGDNKYISKIKKIHVERSLFPVEITLASGKIIKCSSE